MALGRGLGDILLDVEEAYEKDLSDIDSFELKTLGARVEEIKIDNITANPFQPRKYFDKDALVELSASIEKHGLLQPIVVIEKDDGYLLVAGERRLRAHQHLNKKTIKAIIADIEIDEIKLRELALLENIQREDLNAIELANSYAELIEVHKITHDELSSIVHKSRSQITNTMRLLHLSPYVQEQLILSKITQGHAKLLVGFTDAKQKVLLDSIIGQKLSVRDTEIMVKKQKETKEDLSYKKILKENLTKKHAKLFEDRLPFSFKLKANSVEINFNDEEDVLNFLTILEKQ
jgi:ParB family chromosome partitioning protein